MKLFKRSIATLMVLMLVVSVLTLGISADTQTRDGLTVTLTTDKESYNAGEDITATLTVTNNNETAMETVTLKQLIPEGYELAEGQESEKTVNGLNAGDTVTLTVRLVAVTEAEDDSFNLMEFYREHKTLVHIAGIVLGVIVLIALIALGIHKLRYSFISLFLCAVLLWGAVSGTLMQVKALEPIEGSISVSAVVTADGQERKLEAAVDYSMVPEETTEAVCTVTFDTLGGSAVEPQQVDNGGLAVRPDVPTRDGHVFVGWYADEACENAFDFTAPITKSCTVYAYWINTEDETDTDGDGLTDELERYFGTDKEKVDTDGDGLNDYVEIMMLNYDPLKTDTDGNGTTDDREDLDQDGLVNVHEVQRGTDPTIADTDSDALSDADEIHTHTTDPLLSDTDGDGVSDGKEIELGTDPLAEQAVFEMEVFADTEDSVTPSVKIDLPGEQVESLSIEAVHNETFFPETMPGYMGQAYDFNVDGEFESAEISFEFDASLLEAGADPVIYYFNEETQELEALETVIEGNVAKATVQHFSKYILVDRKIYEDQFMWTDVWDAEKNYTSVEIILVIDDSGSLGGDYGYISSQGIFDGGKDPTHKRLEVARDFVDSANKSARIGIVKFDGVVDNMTNGLIECDENGKASLKDLLQFTYRDSSYSYNLHNLFDSRGQTYMYSGIDTAMEMFSNSAENVLKVIIVFTDGDAHDLGSHSSTVNKALANDIKIYSVGLGTSSSYFNNYLKPLAANTGGAFYEASNADQLSKIYANIKEKIDIETDSDGDGIPDYYEDNMIYFNGVKLVLDKNNPDSDGDGLKDGEEVELKYEYNEDRTQVKVTGKIIGGNPVNKDTDGDGVNDNLDSEPLKKGLKGGIIGKLTLVSCYNTEDAGWTSGHTFFVYTSYINDSIDMSSFAAGWSKKDDAQEWSWENLERDSSPSSSYQMLVDESVTIGNGAFGAGWLGSGDVLGGYGSFVDWVGESNESGAGEENGVCYNMELYKHLHPSADLGYSYLHNTYICEDVTEAQLRFLIYYLGLKIVNYWNLTHNCAEVACKAWNLISDTDVNPYNIRFFGGKIATPKGLKLNLRTLENHSEDYVLAYAFD